MKSKRRSTGNSKGRQKISNGEQSGDLDIFQHLDALLQEASLQTVFDPKTYCGDLVTRLIEV